MKGFLCLLARTLRTCARSLPSFGLIRANYRGYLSTKGVTCPTGPQSKRWKLLKKKPSKSLPLAVPISSPIDSQSTFKPRGNPYTCQAREGKKVAKSSWQGERFVSEGEDFDLRIQGIRSSHVGVLRSQSFGCLLLLVPSSFSFCSIGTLRLLSSFLFSEDSSHLDAR
ncbi:hypothetical protein BDM02DRAFT_1250405 [Thelephora ganbajun]|uniref:Uncharacterized protein n=1 Tax=Thelephora ganbajun TaxID=370292 RepID=A0ACB6Z4B5_THEGA|nr:hypothetical protein BDM02DRAFT_1250405 [Thelephora ganbajun]